MDRSLISDRAAVTLPVVTSASLRPNAVLTWTQIGSRAPQLASTMTNYLAQMAISSRPGTVESAGLSLRVFAEHLIESDPGCRCVADISRTHIESFKLALAKRPGKNSDRPASVPPSATSSECCARSSSASSSGTTRLPAERSRSSPGTSRRLTSRCRAFWTTPLAAKLMASPAKETIFRSRLIVEFLARTGMRAARSGPPRRRGVPPRRPPLVADPSRQAPQRPHRAAPPGPRRPDRRLPGRAGSEPLGSSPGPQRRTALRPSHGPSLRGVDRPAGRGRATSILISCAIRSPPIDQPGHEP